MAVLNQPSACGNRAGRLRWTGQPKRSRRSWLPVSSSGTQARRAVRPSSPTRSTGRPSTRTSRPSPGNGSIAAAAAALPGAAALAHRVAAADGPDDELADELEATASQEIEARAVYDRFTPSSLGVVTVEPA